MIFDAQHKQETTMDEKQPSHYYTAKGQYIHVVRIIDDAGFIGSLCYEEKVDGEYDDHYIEIESEPQYYAYSDVFISPPTDKLHQRIVDLNNEIAEKQKELHQHRVDTKKAAADKYDAERRLKSISEKLDDFRSIELYLSNGITHYVDMSASVPVVVSAGDTEALDNKKLRLITFSVDVGRQNIAPRWTSNRYHDGSGRLINSHIIPCASEEEAEISIKKVIQDKLEMKGIMGEYLLLELVEAANKHGVPVPERRLVNYKRIIKNRDESEQREKSKRIQQLRKELAGLGATAA